ncbi:MAG: S41 family peptidase [Candidatus Gribaldobacteria bacterium]|nr:S41 family peptidase [Candidatus Gribaldobacteria bacterium]
MVKNKIVYLVVLLTLVAGSSFLSDGIGLKVGESQISKQSPSQIINADLGMPTGVTTSLGKIINSRVNSTSTVDFSIFWETWNQLEKNYLNKDKIDYQKMVYGAIEGMVNSVGDPYTVFFTPTQAQDFKSELSGEYEGVGLVIGTKDNQLVAISPFKNSQAEVAGLKAGDKILKINDKYTLNLPVEEAARLIRGQSNTEVTLLIERTDWAEPKEFKIKRQVIKIPTLELEIRNEIAIIKIYQFNEILPKEFEKAANDILKAKAQKIIVDVRNNPGGFLEVAQNVTGWFVTSGQIIVTQERGEKTENIIYKSNGPAVLKNYPTVVLMNEGSASASEILAGALRDQNKSRLIGVKSFGKGSVQEQISLSGEASLKVTVAHWLTPNGDLIDGKGLEPDIKVEAAKEGNQDLQLDKAIEALKN